MLIKESSEGHVFVVEGLSGGEAMSFVENVEGLWKM